MERLSGIDAAFLALETPSAHMHVMAALVLDPAGVPGGITVETMQALIAERLPSLPPFRRRLVSVPFGLHNPLWIEDPDFDLQYHVRAAALPAPGGRGELAAFVAEVAERQLDRTRPLWEMWVLEALVDGNVAIVVKLHHSAIDGALGVELLAHLFDLEPKFVPIPAEFPRPEGERIPSDVEMVMGAATSFARRPVQFARALRNGVRSVTKVVQRVRNDPVDAGVPLTAPSSPLNGAITPHRVVALSTLALADIKAVKETFNVTVNDVIVATTAGALRRFLESTDEVPNKPLVAAIPASVRTEDERGVMGNRVSAMFANLAVEIDDPVERLRRASSSMAGAKLVHEDIGGQTLSQWAALAAPALFSRAMRLYQRLLEGKHPPVMNLVLSNVPGPTFPLYCAGARLVELFPLGPVMAGTGLNATVVSYLDRVEVGLIACREILPGVQDLADAFPEALAELLHASERESVRAS